MGIPLVIILLINLNVTSRVCQNIPVLAGMKPVPLLPAAVLSFANRWQADLTINPNM